MNAANLIGHTLDGKYRIERELGRGGMGAVYLATHLGTERAVALKVIAPEFMRRKEFVERFRREARAAGRLRHPNVVDVTDFGLADTELGRVAYLVMEYLDGCTLGEVLEEEKRLPLSWTLDILEQTGAAISEAHRQGIIHRDLKPDNIWLEPNVRGGYTVKVLDFGIAKLEEPFRNDEHNEEDFRNLESREPHLTNHNENATLALPVSENATGENATLALPPVNPREFAEDATLNFELSVQHSSPPVRNNQETLIQVPSEVDAESGTAIFPPARATAVDGAQTTTDKVFGDASETSALTRVGAVLGTPLYMSPEQCRGDKLDIRTDVYSLGIIAYQMLGGAPPFTGNYTDVLEAHKQNPPAPLEAKRVPRKVKATVMSALAKDVANRPPSAEAFVSRLRAHSEGVGALLRRGLVIYSEHLPTFLKLALLLFAPMFLLALMQTTIRFLAVYEVIPNLPSKIAYGVLSFASLFVNVFFSSILAGVTTWIVAQYLAAPLRPVTLRPALAEVRKHLRTFAGTVMPISIAALFGLFLCVVPGLILFIRYALVAPVVMMEGLRGRAALRRSTQLVKRSLPTVIAVISINLLVPLILGIFMAVVVALTSQGSEPKKTKTENSQAIQENAEGQQTPAAKAEIQNSDNAVDGKQNDGIRITTSMGGPVLKIEEGSGSVEERRRKRINNTVREEIIQLLWLPVAFFIASLFSVVQALLYLKTRQAGGESMQNLLAQFEETDQPQRNWQTRLKDRLEQSGRTASKS